MIADTGKCFRIPICIGYEECYWIRSFLTEHIEDCSRQDSNKEVFKYIIDTMGERHPVDTMGEIDPETITLTYDEIMKIAGLLYDRVHCYTYFDMEDPKDIRLLYEFDIIKSIMKCLSKTHIWSIDKMELKINGIIDALTDPQRQPLRQTTPEPGQLPITIWFPLST